MHINSYIKIIRLSNALMAAGAVFLGFWIAGSESSAVSLLFLMVAAISATGFGNIINDLQDISSDRINHPDRPLPRGTMSSSEAALFGSVLAAISLGASFSVSSQHGVATVIPLLLLVAYALFLKATPLAGNILVALLVAYPLIFGALNSPGMKRLFWPAVLAFLLNFSREIIKDLQDRPGDSAANCKTTAVLPSKLLRIVLIALTFLYLALLFVPFITGDFGVPYLAVCLAAVLPLHAIWFFRYFNRRNSATLAPVSKLIKIEMLAGLVSITLDRIL